MIRRPPAADARRGHLREAITRWRTPWTLLSGMTPAFRASGRWRRGGGRSPGRSPRRARGHGPNSNSDLPEVEARGPVSTSTHTLGWWSRRLPTDVVDGISPSATSGPRGSSTSPTTGACRPPRPGLSPLDGPQRPSLRPPAVFTHPQIASVGLTESGLGSGIDYVVASYDYAEIAAGDGPEDTTELRQGARRPTTELSLGAHVIKPEAATVIQPAIQAMSFDLPPTTWRRSSTGSTHGSRGLENARTQFGAADGLIDTVTTKPR